jgi:hypothetical protein
MKRSSHVLNPPYYRVPAELYIGCWPERLSRVYGGPLPAKTFGNGSSEFHALNAVSAMRRPMGRAVLSLSINALSLCRH